MFYDAFKISCSLDPRYLDSCPPPPPWSMGLHPSLATCVTLWRGSDFDPPLRDWRTCSWHAAWAVMASLLAISALLKTTDNSLESGVEVRSSGTRRWTTLIRRQHWRGYFPRKQIASLRLRCLFIYAIGQSSSQRPDNFERRKFRPVMVATGRWGKKEAVSYFAFLFINKIIAMR